MPATLLHFTSNALDFYLRFRNNVPMLLRTLRSFAAEVAKSNLPEWPLDGRYAAACELIRRHRQLDLRHPDVLAAAFTLDLLIPALLPFSAETHFITFEP